MGEGLAKNGGECRGWLRMEESAEVGSSELFALCATTQGTKYPPHTRATRDHEDMSSLLLQTS